MRKLLLAIAIVGTLLCSTAFAQLWSGILNPDRAISWEDVPFSIPNTSSWTQCGPTITPPSSSSAINAAIASCGQNQYVQLAAGTFTASSGISLSNKKNMMLRGAGPGATRLNVGPGGCIAPTTGICVEGNFMFTNQPPANIVNWTAGYTKGTTAITLSNATNISLGQYIVLDQVNEAFNPLSNPAPFISCVDPYVPGGGCVSGRGSTRQTMQVVKVVGKSGNNLNISPGLYFPRFTGSQTPQAWFLPGISGWTTGIGIENLTIACISNACGTGGTIQFNNAAESWVRNVRFDNCQTSCIKLDLAANIVIRDNYLYKSTSGGGSTSYGIDCSHASDILVENNIFHQIVTAQQLGACQGVIFGYNANYFSPWGPSPNFQIQAFFPAHEAGVLYSLFEGNYANGINYDVAHGTNAYSVVFRNRLFGRDSAARTSNTAPAIDLAYNRFVSWIGNVLGSDGYHSSYESSYSSVSAPVSTSIYVLGYADGGGGCGSPACDPFVKTTTLRWGNCDYATKTCRFLASEIPAGSATPGSQVLPPSFYLTVKPAWFGSNPWPAIGPDITGGSDPRGWARRIPAQVCYEDIMKGPLDGTGSILQFDPATCYGTPVGGGGGGTPPPAPANLTVS